MRAMVGLELRVAVSPDRHTKCRLHLSSLSIYCVLYTLYDLSSLTYSSTSGRLGYNGSRRE